MNLLTPAYLGFLSLLIPVILLYFIKPKRKRILVPSFHIWERMSREQQANDLMKMIKRLISLLLHCLLVILLTMALARPFFSERLVPQRIVVVMDASTSMLAFSTDEDGALDGQTRRFDKAREFAKKLAGDLSPEDRMMVIEAATQPRVVMPMTSDRSNLKDMLDTMSARPGQTNLNEALTLAQAVARQLAEKAQKAKASREESWFSFFKANTEEAETVIYVLSDGTDSKLAGVSKKTGELSLPEGTKFFYVPFGSKKNDNMGITAFAIRELLNSQGDHEVLATAHNYSDTDLVVRPELFFLNDRSKKEIEEGEDSRDVDDDEDILDSLPEMVIPAGKSVSLPINETNIRKSGILKLKLSVTGVTKSSRKGWVDLLDVDNVAYAVIPKSKPKKVLLVSSLRNLFLETALGQDSSIEADRLVVQGTINPYKELSKAELAKYDVIIFDKYLPEELPDADLMFFATRGLKSPIQGDGSMTLPLIQDDYDKSHPVMHYVQMTNVNVATAQKLIRPADLRWKVLVQSFKDPLILAGDFPERRMIYVGFHASDSDIVLQQSWPMFVSNSVEWLANRRRERVNIPNFKAGQAATLKVPGTDAKRMGVWPPNKKVTAVSVPIFGGEATYTATEAIGVYHASPLTQEDEATLAESKPPYEAKRFTVNLLSQPEGHIKVEDKLNQGEEPLENYEAGFEMEIRPTLLWLILAVLLLESLLFHFLTVF